MEEMATGGKFAAILIYGLSDFRDLISVCFMLVGVVLGDGVEWRRGYFICMR